MLTAPITLIDTSWCVYSHSDAQTGATLWLGKCRTAELLKCPDARKNRLWIETVLFLPQVKISILAMLHSEIEANRELFRAIERYQPICNKQYQPRTGRKAPERTPVQCEQTGATYVNAAQAADSIGIARATMSAHLNGNPAYRTVKGMSFIRVKPGTPTKGIE